MARQRFSELRMTAAEAAAGVPTGRITTSEDVASAVAWLLRPEARNITGHALPIDGGSLVLP
jgi:3-oxoacyl-[acyl-carrier protein] reductase